MSIHLFFVYCPEWLKDLTIFFYIYTWKKLYNFNLFGVGQRSYFHKDKMFLVIIIIIIPFFSQTIKRQQTAVRTKKN